MEHFGRKSRGWFFHRDRFVPPPSYLYGFSMKLFSRYQIRQNEEPNNFQNLPPSQNAQNTSGEAKILFLKFLCFKVFLRRCLNEHKTFV